MYPTCILCGRKVLDLENIRTGATLTCSDHRREFQGPAIFSEQEAFSLGIKRVSLISLDQMKEEGLIAFHQLERLEEILLHTKAGSIYDYDLKVIKAKRAYLKAFD